MSLYCKVAKLQARIKPTTLCLAIDKENSIESLLDLLYYIYTITIIAMHLVSYSPYVHQLTPLLHAVTVTLCDMTILWLLCDVSHTPP